jgi:adenylyltransferase/sulfurtransferase
VPTSPTVASIIAGLQVQEALKLLHELPVDAGQALVFNGESSRFYKTAFQRRDECLSHETYGEPVELPLSAPESTASDLFAAVREHFETSDITLALDRDLVISLDCRCGHSRPVMKPRERVPAASAACPQCGSEATPQMVHAIESTSPLAARRLEDLGIPSYDIVRLTAGERTKVFLIAGDRQRIMNVPD